MDGKIRRALSLGIYAVKKSKRALDKTVRILYKASRVRPEHAKRLGKAALKELRAEQKRVTGFLKGEAKRELAKATKLLERAARKRKSSRRRRRR